MRHARLLPASWSTFCALLMLAGLVVAPIPVHATPAANTPDAAAFDALLEQLRGPELWRAPSHAAAADRMAGLSRLLPPDDPLRALQLAALRCEWSFAHDPEGQLAAANEGLGQARTLGRDALAASFHYCRSAALEELRGMSEALPDVEAGIAIARRIDDKRLLADGLSLRGSTRSLLGEQSRAIPDLVLAQRLYQEAGDHDLAETLLQDIAISYRRMGELDKAREYLEQNEEYTRRLGDWSQLTSNLLQQGYLAEDQGRLDDALDAYDQALALARQHDAPYDAASALLAMAWPWMLRGEHARALALVQRAHAGFAGLGDESANDMVFLRMGQANAGLGRHAQAMAWYTRAAEALERSNNRRYLALLYRARAGSERELGRDDEAFADLERYIELRESITGVERGEQARLLRSQFDNDRERMEIDRVAREQALRERQLQVLIEARRWQWVAMALAGVLLLLLFGLVVRQLARMKRLREIAATDPLTGVANRRSIEQLGEQAVARARSLGEPLTALVLDIDHFKQVNDNHGHLTGDKVLARIAATFRDCLRQFDLLGRTGGEEFLVLLPDTGLEAAAAIAERLRHAVESLDCSDLAAGLSCTVSIGMAELHENDRDLDGLVERADAALYRAKDKGRNRVETGDA